MTNIGVDIIEIDRVELKPSFIAKVLTASEYEQFHLLSNIRRKEYLAGRFAAKEAIFKATQDPSYLNYVVLNDAAGKPYVVDHPEILVSISHERHYAVAFVTVIGG